MKAKLEFNLPEDQEEFNTAQNAYKYKSALLDIQNLFRNYTKYNKEFPKGYSMTQNEGVFRELLSAIYHDELCGILSVIED